MIIILSYFQKIHSCCTKPSATTPSCPCCSCRKSCSSIFTVPSKTFRWETWIGHKVHFCNVIDHIIKRWKLFAGQPTTIASTASFVAESVQIAAATGYTLRCYKIALVTNQYTRYQECSAIAVRLITVCLFVFLFPYCTYVVVLFFFAAAISKTGARNGGYWWQRADKSWLESNYAKRYWYQTDTTVNQMKACLIIRSTWRK